MKASSDSGFKAQCSGHSNFRLRSAVAALCLLAFSPSCILARPTPTLTVRVFNYAHVSVRTLSSAEREANYILSAAAGRQVIWLDCLGKAQAPQSRVLCEMGWSPELPALRLLSGQVTKQFQGLEFGFATVPVLATIHYENIVSRSVRDNSPSEESTLLGCVIAHELGHLFLEKDTHSLVGIMQSHWGRDQIQQAQTSNLRFTPEQVVRLRERVQRLADLQQEMFARMIETASADKTLTANE